MPVTTITDLMAAGNLRQTLTAAGVPLPDGFDETVGSAAWTVTVPAKPTTDAMVAATTPEAFDQAAQEYAAALADHERMVAVQAVAQAARDEVIVAALHRARAEVSPAVIDAFNAKAVEFTSVVESFPDVDVSDLSTDDFDKFAKARAIADDLRRIHAAYNAIHGAPGESGLSADRGWFRIADCEDIDHLRAVIDHRTANQANAYATLAPYVSVVRAGATLRLVTPTEAAEAREKAVDAQGIKNELAKAANPRIAPVNEVGVSQRVTDVSRMRTRAF
ncbi:hypothetical protein [Pseudonocardia alni]|uniref:hypothetical protein n=1 Tax=Pseudonocardia alni TaxID=33907 RepID=UPI00280B369F|nr:hypothetical protein [Pseudonocardia alni]